MRTNALRARLRTAHRARLGDEGGFGLVELVVSVSVLAVLSLAFAGGMASTLKAYTVSRAETIAEELATDHLEVIRRMPYDEVGLVAGNPPGTIQAVRNNVAIDGYLFDIVTSVVYVDDPVPTAFVTQADYKRVRVTITQDGKTTPDAVLETLVAPPAAASSTSALVRVDVVDYGNNSPLPGALVNLTTGPSAPRSDTTAVNGRVTFPALTPNPASGATAFYDLAATVAGYSTLREDTAGNASVHKKLAPSETFNTTIRLYRPVSIVVNLIDTSGAPFTTASTVTVSSSRGDQEFPVTGGTATITSVAGELLVPNVEYTVSAIATSGSIFYVSPAVAAFVPTAGNYPTILQGTFNLTMNPYPTAPLRINTRRGSGSGTGCNFTGTSTRTAVLNVNITGGPAGIDMTVQTLSGTVTVLVPTGATAYSVVVPPQGSYSGSGTKVVTASAICNLRVG